MRSLVFLIVLLSVAFAFASEQVIVRKNAQGITAEVKRSEFVFKTERNNLISSEYILVAKKGTMIVYTANVALKQEIFGTLSGDMRAAVNLPDGLDYDSVSVIRTTDAIRLKPKTVIPLTKGLKNEFVLKVKP